MRTATEKKRINNFLGNRGFATLDDPGPMVQQMGFCVRDHEHFRQMLTACDGLERANMYNALRPHLRFEAKPLDVYLSEAGDLAERKQLPIQTPEGKLVPYNAPVIESEEYLIEKMLYQKLMEFHLTLLCRKCTKVEQFHGGRKADAIQDARNAGWAYEEVDGKSGEICPECLK